MVWPGDGNKFHVAWHEKSISRVMFRTYDASLTEVCTVEVSRGAYAEFVTY